MFMFLAEATAGNHAPSRSKGACHPAIIIVNENDLARAHEKAAEHMDGLGWSRLKITKTVQFHTTNTDGSFLEDEVLRKAFISSLEGGAGSVIYSEPIRKLSEPPRSLRYPPYDTPFIEWYEGIYETVFIAFHPFIRLGAMPMVEPWIIRSDEEKVVWHGRSVGRERVTRNPTYPKGEVILTLGQLVRWKDVVETLDFGGIRDVNNGLLTWIRALKVELEDKIAASLLEDYCMGAGVWPPTEGEFQPLMWPALLTAFDLAGETVICGMDEFGGNVLEKPRSEFGAAADLDSIVSVVDHGSLFPPSKSFLITVDWDSFFTLICGRRAFVERLVSDEGLEGFFCERATTHYWSLEEK